MALAVSHQRCEMREILLREKPSCMLNYSAKGTVPVLVLPDGRVIDESLDIMSWALNQRDPEKWLPADERTRKLHDALVIANDGPFKHHLDRYKYANRYDGADAFEHRAEAETFIGTLETHLNANTWLTGDTLTATDVAIAPFIRQFANAGRAWFDSAPYPAVQKWLNHFLSLPIFESIMEKYPVWQPTAMPAYFPSMDE